MAGAVIRKNKGFSLIELSIVLLIVAMIVASVTIGSTLITTAKVRKSVRDLGNYHSAFQMFRDQYHALPGDFANATSNFGSTTASGAAITNGNNDGVITCASNTDECWQAFIHLAQAGMLSGAYSGNKNTIPAGPLLTNTTPLNITSYSSINLYSASYSTLYNYSTSPIHAIGNWNDTDVSSATQIDSKIDDGIPTSGLIAATSANANGLPSPSCIKQSNGTTDAAYTYSPAAGLSGIYYLNNPAYPCQVMLVITAE